MGTTADDSSIKGEAPVEKKPAEAVMSAAEIELDLEDVLEKLDDAKFKVRRVLDNLKKKKETT